MSVRYKGKPEFDHKKTDTELSGQYEVDSLIECAAMCQSNCVIFGYNPEMMKCRTHTKIFASGISEETGWKYYYDYLPVDCKDLHENGQTNSDVYQIYPSGRSSPPVRVYCDMNVMGGGWTAIQKRYDGSVDFDRTWAEYKNGFGAPEHEVWIGNDLIYQLTKGHNSYLYVSITIANGSKLYELYDRFSVASEAEKYRLYLAGPATGTLGDSMLNTGNPGRDLSEMYFTTSDRDNDRYEAANCAVHTGGGGWWFNSCHLAFLNVRWSVSGGPYLWNPSMKILEIGKPPD
ncbi:fibroleukin-like [Saccostrea cucullata]|uniref:fibroleukin-like n=1 Tax=Saccostrea cuccullata TaxID=36930 RepID=UPI002ED44E79